jgi:hypothetical protein
MEVSGGASHVIIIIMRAKPKEPKGINKVNE